MTFLPLSYYAISGLVNFVTAFIIGFIVLLRNPKSRVNQTFSLISFAVAWWSFFYFLWLNTPGKSLAEFYVRTSMIGVLFMPPLFFHFIVSLLKMKKSRTFLIFNYTLSAIFTPTVYTFLYAKGVSEYLVFPYWPIPGPLFHFVIGHFFLLILYSFYLMARVFKKSKGIFKNQLLYVLIGSAIGFFGGSTNYLAWYRTSVPPILNIFVSLYVIFIAYGIIKHRLWDIRLLVLKSVAYSSAVALLMGGVILSVALFYVKYQLITNLYLLTVMAGFSGALGFYFIYRYFPKYTDKIFAKGRYNPQELLRKLGEIFSTKVILEDLTKATLKTLTKEMRLRRAAFIVTSSSEIDVRQIGYKGVSKYNWKKAVSLVKNKRKMIVADELEETSREKELLRKLNIEVLLPLATENEMVGLLTLGEKSSGDMFTSEDLRLLEVIAPQAAIALENATLVKERDIRIAELDALNNLALSLGSTLSLDQILDQVIEEALRVTGAEDGSIMLLDEETQTLQVKCARGIEPEVSKKARTKLGEGIAGFVAEKGEPTLIINGRHENEYLESCLKREDINSALAVPLKAKEKVIGVLNVNRKKKREVFTKENLDLITSFAAQAAEAIENAKLYEDLQETFFGTISSLAAAVDAKDHYTYGHSEAVTKHTIDIAKEMGLPEEEIKNLEVAGKLHDIGKIGIDEKILNKPGRLTEEERKIINEHPKIAVDILKSVPSLKDIIPYILYHHERYDGKGYPAGLADDIIPLGARILAVADSFNAMRTDRPYRPALSLEEATQELKRCSGTQFDPQVVQAFLKVLNRKDQKLKVVA